LVLALALVTAGCLAAATASTESAESLQDQARDRADERLDDPELIGLWGIETPREVEEDNSSLRIYLDDEPGDGEAASWAYRFVGEERTAIIVVADTIGIVAEYVTPIDEDADPEDIPDELTWDVDSQEAADALAANESWPEMTDAHGLEWTLEHDDNTTVWGVEATNGTGAVMGVGDEVEAIVDAESGEVLEVERDNQDYDPDYDNEPPESNRTRPERGCDANQNSGQITPANDLEAGPVDLEQRGTVAVTVSYEGAGPLDVAIVDEGGDEVYEDSTTMTGTGTYDAEIDGLPADDYELVTSTSSGSANVDLQIRAYWGGGGQECPEPFAPGPSSSASVGPGFAQVDRTLSVDRLS
jgi:hypothetical protein